MMKQLVFAILAMSSYVCGMMPSRAVKLYAKNLLHSYHLSREDRDSCLQLLEKEVPVNYNQSLKKTIQLSGINSAELRMIKMARPILQHVDGKNRFQFLQVHIQRLKSRVASLNALIKQYDDDVRPILIDNCTQYPESAYHKKQKKLFDIKYETALVEYNNSINLIAHYSAAIAPFIENKMKKGKALH